MPHSDLASAARARQQARMEAMSPEARVALARTLWEVAVTAYADANGLPHDVAHRELLRRQRALNQQGRTPSRVGARE